METQLRAFLLGLRGFPPAGDGADGVVKQKFRKEEPGSASW